MGPEVMGSVYCLDELGGPRFFFLSSWCDEVFFVLFGEDSPQVDWDPHEVKVASL